MNINNLLYVLAEKRWQLENHDFSNNQNYVRKPSKLTKECRKLAFSYNYLQDEL